MTLKFTLFGPPRIELDGRPLHIKRRKALALLVYLAQTGRPHSRDALATLFYPEHSQSRARAYFRRDLGVVNSQLVGGWIEADSETAALGQMNEVWIDTAEFRRAAMTSDDEQDLTQLTAATDLYVDDFLAGFSLPDCPEFDEWQFFESENYRQSLVATLKRIISAHENRAAYDQAIPLARRQINLDPINESTQRQLMRLYALSGQQSAALRQYEMMAALLQEELGVAPAAETVNLYEAIKERRLVPKPAQLHPESVIQRPLPTFLTTAENSNSFVGRERELSALQAALESAQAGRGQCRFVIGEAGRGKSMLLQTFARQAHQNDARLSIARGFCNAITGFGDPYRPFREILEMLTGDDNAWGKQLKALASQSQAEIDQAQIVAQYTANLKAIAQKRPLLLIIEDLHWVDVASSGLLFHLSRELADSAILLVGTYRPEEIPSRQSGGSGHPMSGILSELKRTHGDIWLDLGQQTAGEGREFVNAFLDLEPNHFGEEFRIAVFERTSGHALFTAELLRSMQERGDLQQDETGFWVEGPTVDWQTVPIKVEGVIEKRIERLDGELQAILNIASVEGEVFTAEIVAAVIEKEERPLALTLSRELDKSHHLITAQEVKWLTPGQARLSIYRFQHQLFQDYLYHRLDDIERGYLHQAVGEAMEQLYQQQLKAVAAQLAYHFQKAGIVSKAIPYAELACESAVGVHAYNEAVIHISQAVEMAEKAAADADHIAALYIRLGSLLLITKGDGAPEVGRAYQRAYDLAVQLGQTKRQFEALRGLALFQRHRMETDIADRLTREMCALSQQLDDPALIIESSFALGSQSFFSGNHQEAQINLQRSINTYNPDEHHLHDQDPGVASLAYAAINDWMLGYPDKGLAHYTRAIDLATDIEHAYSLTMAHNWASWTSIFRREPKRVLKHAEAAILLSEKHNFPLFQAIGKCHYGWALAQMGQGVEAVVKMEQGLADAVVAWGSDLGAPPFLALLAEIYGRLNQPQKAQTSLDSAFNLIDQIKGHSWAESELYRLRGKLSLTAEDDLTVESDLQQALHIARTQSANSLALRAAIDLARFWHSRSKQREARRVLAEIYNTFTEGFETADLQDAKSLLDSF